MRCFWKKNTLMKERVILGLLLSDKVSLVGGLVVKLETVLRLMLEMRVDSTPMSHSLTAYLPPALFIYESATLNGICWLVIHNFLEG